MNDKLWFAYHRVELDPSPTMYRNSCPWQKCIVVAVEVVMVKLIEVDSEI